jgi:hypothetical protein
MSINPNDLRALADWLDERPACRDAAYMPHLLLIPLHADKWRTVLAELGSFQKEADDKYLDAIVQVGSIEVKATIQKEETCERVQVGEREVEREVYPSNVVPAIVKETEPVFEWVCPPSWLAVDA